MPLYVYLCGACSREQEEVRPMSDTSAVRCTACKKPMRVKPSAPAILMRGWDSTVKIQRMAKDREQRNAEVARRQYDRYGTGQEVAPNVMDKNGSANFFDDWEEAGRFAEGQGYDPATYRKKAEEVKSRKRKMESRVIKRTTA